MATKIVTKNSSTASAVPTASDLVQGELAVNVADKRLFTEDNGGAIVELGTNPSGDVTFQDNGKAIFGAGSDLQIYHDGSNSYISEGGDGELLLRTNGAGIRLQKNNGENMLKALTDGAVQLYYDNQDKLATTSTGIDVTGTATMDGLVSAGTAFVNLTSRPAGVPATAGALWSAQTETGNYGIVSKASSTDSFTYIGNTGSAATLGTSYGSSGSYLPLDLQTSDKKRLSIAANGAISFYEDTGTTPKLFWDASAESLGIGTSSPDQALAVESSSAGVTRVGITNTGNAAAGAGVHFITKNGATQVSNATLRTDNAGNFSIFSGTTSETERMRIDSSGNVSIGTSATSAPFRVNVGTDQNCAINTSGGNPRITAFNDAVTASVPLGFNGSILKFETGGDERMRIDSSGNLLVGKTSADNTTAGTRIHPLGYASFTIANDYPIIANRLSSDGPVAVFRKDGTTVGNIGTQGGDLYLGTDDANIKFYNSASIQPVNSVGGVRDNAIDLGASSARFKDLYLSGNALVGRTSSLSSQSGSVSANTVVSAHGPLSSHATNAGILEYYNDETLLRSYGANSGSGKLVFKVGGGGGSTDLEAMRIDTSGRLLVGYSAADGIGGSPSDNNFSELGKGYINLNRDDTATARQVQFGKNGVVAGYIETAGSSTSYVTSSDQRLKENIADADDAGSKIDAIQVRKYDWKADGSHQDYGMIAQELQTVAPEAVSGDADSEEMMGVDYSKLVPMLIKEIQSLRNRVAQLEE